MVLTLKVRCVHFSNVRILGPVWIFFYQSSLLTQFLSLVTHQLKYPNSLHSTRLAPSLITQIFQLFVDPILVTRAKLLAYPPIFFSFLIFPSPFSPVTLLKHKPEPIKISQASLPRQDRHQWTTPISPTCMAAWSPLSWPSGANKHKETWPISPFLSRMISSDPRQCYLIPFCTLSTCFYLICVFHIWVLRKLLGFSLNSICLCFFLLFGWWENNKGEVVLVFFFF